jgi:K+ transporter
MSDVMSDAGQARPREEERLRALVIGAIGVVYGDIGTSPLYAFRECFHGPHAVAASRSAVESPSAPRLLERCRDHGLFIDPTDVTYVVGRETLLATQRPGMAVWREKLFAVMSRNAGDATGFFRLPPGQVLEIGAQIEL